MTRRAAVVIVAASALSAPALGFAPATLPNPSAHRCYQLRRGAAAPQMGFFDFAQSKGDGLVFKEWKTKDAVDGPRGAGLEGDIDILFKIGDTEKPTRAWVGQPLSEVAAQVCKGAICLRQTLLSHRHDQMVLSPICMQGRSAQGTPSDVRISFLASCAGHVAQSVQVRAARGGVADRAAIQDCSALFPFTYATAPNPIITQN